MGEIKSIVKLNNNEELFKFSDKIYNDYFIRTINKLKLFFNFKGQLIKSEGSINVNFIQTKKKESLIIIK
jgi:hypothetical protein